ncbi:hypothetical protein OPIT5_08285 [Opitutaceae bacterium TAV5]|nr:hypothetical protein OPIT5_08285 [Opitutaceae bacterium TAV5]
MDFPAFVTPLFFAQFVASSVIMLFLWMKLRKSAREEAGEVEPRAKPPLHVQFVTRREFELFSGEVKAALVKVSDDGEKRIIRIYDKMDEQTRHLTGVITNALRDKK